MGEVGWNLLRRTMIKNAEDEFVKEWGLEF
jgi:hypothetical protein